MAAAGLRRTLRRLVVVLVALVVLLGAAAVIGEKLARDEVEKIVHDQVSIALGGDATTTVHDQIILLSVARNRLDRVTGTADAAVLSNGEQSVVLDHLDFTATGVRGIRDATGPVAGTLDATATLSWDEAVRLTGVQLKPVAGGRVELTHQLEIWGATVPVTLTAVPGVDPASKRITLTDPVATLSKIPVPKSLLVPLLAKLTEQAVLPDVLGLGYRSLRATEAGFVVTLSGTDIPLQR